MENGVPESLIEDSGEITRHKDRFVRGVNSNFTEGITLADFNAYTKALSAIGENAAQLLRAMEASRKHGDAIDEFLLHTHGWRFQALVESGEIKLAS